MLKKHSKIEIEVKIPITNAEKIVPHLMKENFTETHVHEETDTYYNSEHYDLREQDKALRIRKVVDLKQGTTWAELNCKGPKLDDISMSRKETEMPIENPDAMENVLSELGFCPVKPIVKKIRHYYQRGRMTACVDEVEGLGTFLELEIIEDGEDKRADGLAEIEVLMQKIGYSMEDSVRTSYLSLLMGQAIF